MTNWKNKLLAYLHDPPHKPFRIAGHEDARLTPLNELGLTEADMEAWDRNHAHKCADWQAAAADRFPFPRADVMRVDWKQDEQLSVRHPLAGERFQPADQPRRDSSVGETWVNAALKGIPTNGGWKEKFFRVWRLWPERCAREHHPILAYLPADTRIPDHTLWHHNGVVSALEATGERTAFLMFQIGPVQDFIKQARKLQDLWSGSYLLSFLISKALASLALELGPDCVIYPNLRGVPLLDWWWSQTLGLFPKNFFEPGKGRLHPNELLTPSLPNRFLALVPAGAEGQRIARAAEKAVRDLWLEVADKVHAEICLRLQDSVGKFDGWDHYWQQQVDRFPVIEWTIHPWLSEKEALNLADSQDEPTPPLTGGWQNHPLRNTTLWRDMIPMEHRESWHGTPNDAFAWALQYARTDWQFAALKNTRGFVQWPQPKMGHRAPPKDHLNGRDEVLGGAEPEKFWEALRPAFKFGERDEFKGKQFYGAVTVIKRLWARVYLKDHIGWKNWKPNFDSVPDIAQIDRSIDAESEEAEKYYAVLCMDGDDMGQWVSGVKAPLLKSVLAEKAWNYFANGKDGVGGWDPEKASGLAAEKVQRPLGPGYHAALSDALSNFGLYFAGQVVEAFSGQLIYAGGDDVLAMLPASRALDCAHALQLAFRGQLPPGAPQRVREEVEGLFEFFPDSPGFIRCRRSGEHEAQRPNWPLMVPGPRATASVGIAIGHVHAPMQDTIQAARDAESVAKRIRDKGAFCLRILKRSGEAADFAARWKPHSTGQASVADVWSELEANEDKLTGRFPYRYLQLVRPLLVATGKDADEGWEPRWSRPLIESVEAELRHVHYQQNETGAPGEMKMRKAADQAARWIRALIGDPDAADARNFHSALTPRNFIHFWMAWAFVNRISQPNEQP